eukprot:gene2335-3061_t
MEAMVHEMEDNHKEEKEMWELERAASASEVATARAQLTQMEAALRSSRAGRLLVDKPALPEWAPEEGEEEEEEVRAAPEPAPEETTDESNVGEDYLASNGASASCLSAAAPAAASPPPVVASVAEKELNVAQAESSLETAATTPSATRRTMAATPSATRRTMAATPSAARPTMAATPSATRPMAAATPSTARPKEEATHEGLLSALKMAQSELRVMTCRAPGVDQGVDQGVDEDVPILLEAAEALMKEWAVCYVARKDTITDSCGDAVSIVDVSLVDVKPLTAYARDSF